MTNDLIKHNEAAYLPAHTMLDQQPARSDMLVLHWFSILHRHRDEAASTAMTNTSEASMIRLLLLACDWCFWHRPPTVLY